MSANIWKYFGVDENLGVNVDKSAAKSKLEGGLCASSSYGNSKTIG